MRIVCQKKSMRGVEYQFIRWGWGGGSKWEKVDHVEEVTGLFEGVV